MKIALISDLLTYSSLKHESYVKSITPYNYKLILKYWKPDFLLVESAWQGYKNRWKYKIASYDDYSKRNNKKLQKVVKYAKELGIPTVFWNKEDGIHFNRFLSSAKLFDHIFTVDENCIQKYIDVVENDVTVNTLMFSVQPKLHSFTGFNFKYNSANFVGSYSHHVHDRRRKLQDMMFLAASKIDYNITVFDRNSKRRSKNYRYPKLDILNIKPAVSYEKTAQVYKSYKLSLNVNTIEDSKTMFSRRLIEILACGGIAVTTPSDAVNKMFMQYAHVMSTEEEMKELFYRVSKFGLSNNDKEMAREGASYVSKEHTWAHRISDIEKVLLSK